MPTVTDTSTPNIQEVAELIKKAQDIIDYRTGHAWRLRFSGTKSGEEQTARREYHDISKHFEYRTGRPVYLNHRFVKTFDSNEGDKLEVWNGDEDEDWLLTKTEGREEDFWVDYEAGIVFINSRWGITRNHGIRVLYRYGENAVNKTVQDVCTKLVVIDLLLGESRSAFVPEGGAGSISHTEKINLLRQDIEDGLQSLKEFQTPGLEL